MTMRIPKWMLVTVALFFLLNVLRVAFFGSSRSLKSIRNYESKLFFSEMNRIIAISKEETGFYPGCSDGRDHQFTVDSAFFRRSLGDGRALSRYPEVLSILERLDSKEFVVSVYLDGDEDGKVEIAGVIHNQRIVFSPSVIEGK